MSKLESKLSKYSIDQIKKLESKAFKKGLRQRASIKKIIELLPIVEFDFGKIGPIHRCRINTNKHEYLHLSELMWPPEKNKSNHRLLANGVVYFSSKLQTSLLEVLPNQKSELSSATMIAVKSKSITRIYSVGEVHNFITTDSISITHDPDALNILRQTLSQLSQASILKWGLLDAITLYLLSSEDRMISQFTSDKLFQKVHSNSIFCFPSTRHIGGTNFAVRPQTILDNFELCGGMNIKYAEHIGYGLIDMAGDKTLARILADGSFVWKAVNGQIYNGMSLKPVRIETNWVNAF